MRSKWKGSLPFTIISSAVSMECLYSNPEPGLYWKDVKNQSKAWRQRHFKLNQCYGPKPANPKPTEEGGGKEVSVDAGDGAGPQKSSKFNADANEGVVTTHDLDPNATCMILPDGLHPKTLQMDRKPFSNLMQAINNHFSSLVPTLALRTGFSTKFPVGTAGASIIALDILTDRVQSGVPVRANLTCCFSSLPPISQTHFR